MTKRRVRAPDVQHALGRALAEAALVLNGRGISDEAIHAARKKLKSARAKLRVLRDAVGRDAYARANAAIRDAGRALSDARDSKVVLDAVDALLARKGSRARRLVLTALRARQKHAHATARTKFETERLGAATAAKLRRVASRVARLKPRRGAATLVRAMTRVYRKARKVLGTVERDRSAENLHELRKQVKYLREALAPLDSAAVAPRKLLQRADRLASALGDDHDLHVLGEIVGRAPTPAAGAGADDVQRELAARQAKLRKRALRGARRLLRDKPSRFARGLAL